MVLEPTTQPTNQLTDPSPSISCISTLSTSAASRLVSWHTWRRIISMRSAAWQAVAGCSRQAGRQAVAGRQAGRQAVAGSSRQ